MQFTYEATLEDVAEAPVRLYFRSKATRAGKWRGVIICAIVFAVFGFLGFHSKETVSLPAVCVAAALWGAGIYLLSFKSVMRGRIRKFVAKELSGKLPFTAACQVADGTLLRAGAGLVNTFELAELQAVNEDARWIELAFTDNRLCVIPQRAFESEEQKTEFLVAVGRGPTGGGALI